MNNKLYCCRALRTPATSGASARLQLWTALLVCVCIMGYAPPAAAAGDAPQWMHALVNAPLPPHDEKTDAVLLYSETNVSVYSADRIKTVVREAYKILRPQGRDRGTVIVYLNSNRKVTSLHGWCIPAQGKDYEVKDKEALEVSPPMVDGGELIDDVKARVLQIPASDPGNIVGYEYEVEERPLVLQDTWDVNRPTPFRKAGILWTFRPAGNTKRRGSTILR